MNPHIEGLVQTSINCGIVKVDENTLRLCASVRSSVSAEKEALVARVRAAAESVGATFTTRGDYPGWEYRENSYIRDLASRVYCDMYGKAPQVITIHAGLECGLFSDAIDDLDCISFGPDNKDIHTTEEHISISSCARVYDYILELLKKI
jgi:dipeptidase D